MRFWQHHKELQRDPRPHCSGFTLVEMLVVAPIAVLTIATIVSIVVSITGDALVAQDRATTTYGAQDTLDRIEQDVRLSSAFLSSFSALQPGQGKNATAALMSDTSPFATANGDLILNQTATSSSPYDAARVIVYYANQPNPCGAPNTSLNRALAVRTIYFLQNGTLWRRVVVPTFNTSSPVDANTVCVAPWQRNTCPSISMPTCQTVDERMLDNVSAFTITYYTPSGAVTADSRTATNLSIQVTVTKTIAGNTFTTSSTLRVTRINTAVDPIP